MINHGCDNLWCCDPNFSSGRGARALSQVTCRCHVNSYWSGPCGHFFISSKKKIGDISMSKANWAKDTACDRREEGMTYAQKVGSTICPVAKKLGGVGETKEVLNETPEKKQARWGAEELGGTLHHCGNFWEIPIIHNSLFVEIFSVHCLILKRGADRRFLMTSFFYPH